MRIIDGKKETLFVEHFINRSLRDIDGLEDIESYDYFGS